MTRWVRDPGVEDLEHRVREAVANAMRGTHFAPPAGVLLECVVVMGWMDDEGEHVTTHILCGSPWATRGLISQAVAHIDIHHKHAIEANYKDDE